MTEHKPRALADLRANERNPRTISQHKRDMLRRSLQRFGDLGGIIYNRRTQQLVGGHQRLDVIRSLKDGGEAKVHLEHHWDTAQSADGSKASGYIEVEGQRYSYREVDWDETTEQAAMISANKGAGEWDVDLLKVELQELETTSIDLDLTMFDSEERAALFGDAKPDKDEPEADFDEQYKVIVECRDEAHQAELLGRFNDEGLTCKALVG